MAAGLILVAAAGLKLVGLSASPVAKVGWLADPAVQSAAAVVELALGGWLLAGVLPRLAWLFAVGAFSTFALLSGKAALDGQPTCNCFGPLAVNPWWVCGFDLLLVGLLASVRPRVADVRRELFGSGGGLVGTAAVAAVATLVWHGTGMRAVFDRAVHGRTLRIDRSLEFGTVEPGRTVRRALRVWNDGPSPISLVGGTSDCSCLVTGDLPVVIPAGELRTVTVELRAARDARGRVYRQIELWTDSPRQPRLPVVVGFTGEGAGEVPAATGG